MRIVLLTSILFLAACSASLPSFYDDNESLLAAAVRFHVNRLDCSDPELIGINDSVNFLNIYSESKKSEDIRKLVLLMKETSDSLELPMSETYCKIKKKVLEKQSADITNAIMRRF